MNYTITRYKSGTRFFDTKANHQLTKDEIQQVMKASLDADDWNRRREEFKRNLTDVQIYEYIDKVDGGEHKSLVTKTCFGTRSIATALAEKRALEKLRLSEEEVI